MEEPTNRDIGARIKKLRVVKGLTQEELGREVGVTYQQIQKYESGRNGVSAARLSHIVKVLDASYSEFFDDNPQATAGFSEEATNAMLSPEAFRFAIEFDYVQDQDVRNKIIDLVRSLTRLSV